VAKDALVVQGEIVDLDALAKEVNDLHGARVDGVRGSLLTAYQAGEKLCTVRECIEAERGAAGTWKAWCEEDLEFTMRTARVYCEVYTLAPLIGTDRSFLSGLSLTEGVRLLAGPPESDGKQNLKANQNKGIIEWYTPADWIERARKAMGSIDLDPASNEMANKIVKAKRFYDAEDNGLERDWYGNVFLNPPFQAKLAIAFIAKLCTDYENKMIPQAVLLTNNNTDTTWWHQAAGVSAAICFTKGRVPFYNPKQEIAAPTNGHTFCYMGGRVHSFVKAFQDAGTIMTKME